MQHNLFPTLYIFNNYANHKIAKKELCNSNQPLIIEKNELGNISFVISSKPNLFHKNDHFR